MIVGVISAVYYAKSDPVIDKYLIPYFCFTMESRILILLIFGVIQFFPELGIDFFGPKLTIPEFIKKNSHDLGKNSTEYQEGDKCSICLKKFKLGGGKVT